MSARKKLWATTKCFSRVIKIYKVPNSSKYDGYTYENDVGSVYICSRMFSRPAKLDETLIHEFIHTIEHLKGIEALGHEQEEDASGNRCTKSAKVLGRGLSQMLRNLKQVNHA